MRVGVHVVMAHPVAHDEGTSAVVFLVKKMRAGVNRRVHLALGVRRRQNADPLRLLEYSLSFMVHPLVGCGNCLSPETLRFRRNAADILVCLHSPARVPHCTLTERCLGIQDQFSIMGSPRSEIPFLSASAWRTASCRKAKIRSSCQRINGKTISLSGDNGSR